MNPGVALAAILSPMAFGIGQTSRWTLPFPGTIGLLLIGAVAAFAIRPGLRFRDALTPDPAPVIA
ncbi:MAG: hypothetical protein WDN49_00040 [Acetobacteraceae bacterium]